MFLVVAIGGVSASWYVPEELTFSTGGNTGQIGLGIEYNHFDTLLEHRWSIGYTDDESYRTGIYQFNAEFVLNPFRKALFKNRFSPIGIGVLVIYINPDEEGYFVGSPEQYPNDDYYDPTAVRLGLTFSQSLDVPNVLYEQDVKLRWWVASMERQLVSYFNNQEHIEIKEIFSLGLSFAVVF